jgi:hypothetical protein
MINIGLGFCYYKGHYIKKIFFLKIFSNSDKGNQ